MSNDIEKKCADKGVRLTGQRKLIAKGLKIEAKRNDKKPIEPRKKMPITRAPGHPTHPQHQAGPLGCRSAAVRPKTT